MKHGYQKAGALVVGGIANQEVLKANRGLGESRKMPVRHGPTVDGPQVWACIFIDPPECRGIVAAIAFTLDDLFVGFAAGFPVRTLKFHVGQLDPSNRAVGILRESEIQKSQPLRLGADSEGCSGEAPSYLAWGGGRFVAPVSLQNHHACDIFQIVWSAFISGLEADFQFAFGGEFFPCLMIPIGAFGDQEMIGRRGLVENLVESGFDPGLIEFLHDLRRGDGSSGSVADDHERRDEPILPDWRWDGFL